MIENLIFLVIYLIVIGLILWLLIYLIDHIPLMEPFRQAPYPRAPPPICKDC